MVLSKFICSLAIIYIPWLLANNLQASSELNSSIYFPSLNPWYKVSLPEVKGIYKEPKLNLITHKQTSSATALADGIVWKIKQSPDRQSSTVYIIHKDENSHYYCSIYPSIELLFVSLNKLVTRGFKVGTIHSKNLPASNIWQPELIDLQTKEKANISVKQTTLILNSALSELQNKIQAQRFNQLPNLKILQP